MQDSKFSFTDKIILSVILLNVYAISILPGGGALAKFVYPVHIFIFFLILISRFQYNTLSASLTIKLNFFLVLGIFICILFVLSSFYINLGYNLQLRSIAKLLTYPIIIYLFFFSFPGIIFKEDLLFEKFLTLYLIFSLFSAIVALLLLFLGINYNIEYTYSTTAFLEHPNTFAFFFTFAIPIVIYKYFTKQFNLVLTVVIEIILLSCLLFTFSRAGYIGAFTSILILTFRRSKVIFIFAILVVVFLLSSFFLNFAASKTDSSVARLQVMSAAYGMIMNNGISNFLWGYGIFNNVKVFGNIISIFGRNEADPHNVILLLGIQFGMLLTAAVIVAILYLLVRVLLLARKKLSFSFKQKINLSLSIVVGILFQDLFEDIVVYPEYFVMPLFLIFLGYLYYSVYRLEEKIT